MHVLRTILVRIILLPIVGLICSRTALEIAHANDWYPERQLARLLMSSPTILAIEWVQWGLIALLAVILWGAADYFFYRRPIHVRRALHRLKIRGWSGVTWDFEDPTRHDFLNMRGSPDYRALISGFQARGRNNTGKPIIRVSGSIRSDRGNRPFPLLIAGENGVLTEPELTNGVAKDSYFIVGARFAPDHEPIPSGKFLIDFPGFVFVFEYDGQTYTYSFSAERIERAVAEYERNLRPRDVRGVTRKETP